MQTLLAGSHTLDRRWVREGALAYRHAAVRNIGLQEKPHDVPTITIFHKLVSVHGALKFFSSFL
jgi:hypothetical protein